MQIYQHIFENIPAALLVIDPSGRIMTANTQVERVFGYKQNALIGQPIELLIAQHFAYTIELGSACLSELCTRSAGAGLELSGRRSDGREIPVEVMLSPLEVGERASILCVVRDISERKKAEAALQASEERYRNLVEQSSDGIFISDAQGRYLDVNSAGCEMFDYTRDEILRLSIADLVAPEEVLRVALELAHLLGGSPARSEWRFQRKDGTFFYGEVNARQLPDLRLLATLRDVSDRKQAEDALIAAREEWEQSFNALTDYVCVLDRSGRILRANRAMRERFELSHGNLIGMDYRTVYCGTVTPIPEPVCNAVLSGGAPVDIETTLETIPGFFLASCYPLKSPNGEQRGAVHVVRDITKQRRLEAQLQHSQKMQAIGQLAGSVAHEFNNLLTIINGYGDLLLTESMDLPLPARELVVGICDMSQRASQVARQLLLFSRKADLRPEVLDLNEVLQRSGKMLQRLIGEDILLTMLLESDLQLIKADSGQLEQVVINLLLNARDAMPQGGQLTIESRNLYLDVNDCAVHPEAKPGHFVQLIVSDTGCGMAPDVKARLFEPFFTTKGPGKGTGLGLATVYGIVQQTGGFITVRSDLGIGTTFTVFLPALAVDASALPSDPAIQPVLSGSETVLLVEDDAGVRRIARRALDLQGYAVLEATSGPEAIRLVEQHQGAIDLLISDVIMPGMSGRRLAEILHARCPELKVLFISGYNEEAIARHGIFASPDAFLQKPFTLLTLAQKVRDALDAQPCH